MQDNIRNSMIVNLTKKFATDLENSENSKQAQNIALIN